MTSEERTVAYQDFCRVTNEDVASAWMFESVRYGASTGRIGNFVYTPSPGGGRYYSAAETWYIKR
jgi:peptide/nickel transport system substrate-binding protein